MKKNTTTTSWTKFSARRISIELLEPYLIHIRQNGINYDREEKGDIKKST